jgi:hypothetical protein
MIRLLQDPYAIAILVGAATSLALARTRLASVSILSALLVLVLGAELGCFDGNSHDEVGAKVDATIFIWARAVELRALGGLAIIVVAAPAGAAAAKVGRFARGSLMGLAVMCPFGFGMLASSIRLQLALRCLLSDEFPADRVAYFQAAVAQSSWLLGMGTLASIVGCAGLAIAGGRR